MHNFFVGNEKKFIERVLSEAELAKKNKQARFVGRMNAFGIYLLNHSEEFRRYMESCDLIFCDGIGAKWAYQLGYNKRVGRITAAEFLPWLLGFVAAKGLSMGLIGYEQWVIKRIQGYLQKEYPGLKLNLVQHGFFPPDEKEEVFAEINSAKCDIVFVGMGMPKQESFLLESRQELPPALYFPVGASFIYLAGLRQACPKWMSDGGLEWLYRLNQEPRRLGARYLKSNSFLAWWTLRGRIKNLGPLSR